MRCRCAGAGRRRTRAGSGCACSGLRPTSVISSRDALASRRCPYMPCTRRGSAMMACTVMRGLSEAYGSWKTICMLRRSRRSSPPPASSATSWPRNRTVPDGRLDQPHAGSGPVVDFPQPDSPTRPSVSPGATSKRHAARPRGPRRPSGAGSRLRIGKCLTRSRDLEDRPAPRPSPRRLACSRRVAITVDTRAVSAVGG